MKISKTFLILITSLLSFLFCSCNTTQREYEKITDKDKQILIVFARSIIKSLPSTKVTAEEKEIILKSNPEFSINYTGDKKGRYSLMWNIKQKSVTYTGMGDIACPKSSFSKINIISVNTNPMQ